MKENTLSTKKMFKKKRKFFSFFLGRLLGRESIFFLFFLDSYRVFPFFFIAFLVESVFSFLFLFFLFTFLVVFSYFLVFFYKFPPPNIPQAFPLIITILLSMYREFQKT